MAKDQRSPFTVSYPLGPTVAPTDVDADSLRLLFDDKNKLVSQLNHEKSLIIGRKGSGKTTLLTSVRLTEPDASVFYLPSEDFFARILREISELSKGVVFVEQVSRLWDFVFWGIAISHAARQFGDRSLLDFSTALRASEPDQKPYERMASMLSVIKAFPPQDWPIPEKITYKKIANLSFLQAKQIAIDQLNKNGAKIYLLMDSLEDFKLDIPQFGVVVAGLLKCLGEFNQGQTASHGQTVPVVLRCCLPAERYFDYISLSTNPLKDFRNGIVLHWSARELIQLSAVRYARFLQEHYASFYIKNVQSLDLRRRDDLTEFWDLIFPEPVISGFGTPERPLAYILRHTQLLPRHFIVYLNDIISTSLKNPEVAAAYGIRGDQVKSGVMRTEGIVKEQILEAYSSVLHDPRRACEHTLKNLPSVFTWSDFDQVASRVTKMGIPGVTDRNELISLLTQIGAIGRVVGESEKYFQGTFEYMVPHRLIFSDRDKFCIHPVFTEAYNADVRYEGARAVYTYWSGLTDDELKHWM